MRYENSMIRKPILTGRAPLGLKPVMTREPLRSSARRSLTRRTESWTHH